MKKQFLLFLWMSILFTPLYARSSEELKRAEASATTYSSVLYGSVIYSSSWEGGSPKRGIYSFPAAEETSFTTVNTEHGGLACQAGTYKDGKFYTFSFLGGYEYSYYYRIFDATTWKQTYWNDSETAIKDLPSDLTYDPVSDKFYGVTYENGAFKLCTFNPDNGASTVVAEILSEIIAIAANKEGVLYGISAEGALYIIGKEDAALTLVGSTGIEPKNAAVQSMSFDNAVGKLFWSACLQNGKNALYEVNIATGAVSLISNYPGNEQITGLYVGAPITSLSAPDAVKELAVNFTEQGSLTGKVSFKAPSFTYGGEALTGNVTVKVVMDGEELLNIENLTAGQSYESAVMTFTAGEKHFTAIAYNAAGGSPETKLSAWAGEDLPLAVTNLILAKSAQEKPFLKWDAPTGGQSGGFIDFSKLKYKVVRNPGNVVLTDKLSETSYTDNSIGEDLTICSYTITAVTSAGEGTPTTTEEMIFNSVYSIPYSETFETNTMLKVWTIVDVNGGITWDWSANDKAMKYGSEGVAADDWLISPPIKMQGGAVYQVKYSYKVSLFNRPENLKVTMGTSTTPSDHTTTLANYAGITNQSYTTATTTYIAAQDATYHLGFYAYSEASKSGILIDNIEITLLYPSGTPNAVTDLEIIPGAKGAASASLSMKAPAITMAEMELTQLSSVAIYRGEGETAVKTFENPQPGAALAWEDTNPEAGLNTYRIEVSNNIGKGPATTKSVFIGTDVPAAVTELTLENKKGNAFISWIAPTEGKNGGYLDTENLTYTIVRLPDNTTVAESYKETSFLDETITTDLGNYQYKVISFSSSGEGASATSATVMIGEGYKVPYKETFENAAALTFWTILDLNKGNKWQFESYYKWVSYNTSYSYDADDWLISPPIKLHEGYTYSIKYSTRTNSASSKEKLKVTIGTSNTPEAQTTELNNHTELKGTTFTVHEDTFTAPADGAYFLGFYVYTAKGSNKTILDNIEVSIITAAGVPGPVTDLTIVPGAEGTSTATISFVAPTVTSTGTSLAGLTAIDIYRDTEEPLHTFEMPEVGATLSWTDETPKAGHNTYRIVAKNEAGSSIETSQEAFVGFDIPTAVGNLQIEEQESGLLLSWTAPTNGANGGFIQADHLTYKIIRNPDAITLAEHLTETQYIDNSITTQNLYSYTLIPVVPQGDGAPATLDSLLLGAPYSAPFHESFATATPQNTPWISQRLQGTTAEWTIADNGRYPNIQPYDEDGGLASFNAFYTPKGEQARFVSPKIDISAMANPLLIFQLYNYTDPALHWNDKVIVEISIDGGDFKEIPGATFPLAANNNGWNPHKVYLLEYLNSSYIQLAFKGISDRGNNIHIDNITIEDTNAHDLEALSITGPAKIDFNKTATYTLQIKNHGATTVSDYQIHLYRDDVLHSKHNGVEVKPQTIVSTTIDVEATIEEAGSEYIYKAQIIYSKDQDNTNNTTPNTVLTHISADYPIVNDLQATPDNNTATITLTWTDPVATYEPHTESFETYQPFAIDHIGDWTLVDRDKAGTVSFSNIPDYPNKFAPMAFQVFNMAALKIENPLPYDGDQMMVCFATNSVSGPNDDWLISPLLPGTPQTVTFYARSLNTNFELERIRFHHSDTDTNPDHFTQIGQDDIVVPTTWTKYEFELPQGTRHFAIQSVSNNSFVLFVDQITYTKADPEIEALQIAGHQIYRDNILIHQTDALTHTYHDTNLQKGSYQYRLITLYDKGQSYYSNTATAHIDPVEQAIIDHQTPIHVHTVAGAIIVQNAQRLPIQVISIDGRIQHQSIGNTTDRIPMKTGFYLVLIANKAIKVVVP